MNSEDTVTIPRREFDALIERSARLEDTLAAWEADDGFRIPHSVAVAIMRGTGPVRAFRTYQGISLRKLSERSGIAAGYISEIERGIKPGSTSALARLAGALGTTIDALVIEES